MFDSASQRAAANDGELDRHYEREFHLTKVFPRPGNEKMSESNIQASPGSIFICYRREDSADVTGRIYDRLVDHFGAERVFMDVEAIRLGYDFRSEIDQTIKVCSIVIVVIGDKWLAETDGKRRIDDENDRVRIEIESALRREIPIIPVLARGASHPTKAMLPASLEALAYRHGTSIRHEHFRGDVDSLISQMDKLLARQESTPSKPAEPKEPTTPVKSAQTTPSQPAIPPVALVSAIAASKKPAVSRRKRLITVSAVGATVILLLAITGLLTRPRPSLTTPHPAVEPSAEILPPANFAKSDSQSVSSAEAAKRVQADIQPPPPRPIYTPKPAYPAEWAKQGLTGKGVVLVTIDEQTGKVIGAQMLQSTGNKQLDDSAIEAYSQWRFDPRTVAASQLKIPVEFAEPPASIANLSQVAASPEASPAPTPKHPALIYAPAPAFPAKAQPGVSGTGRFRLTFDAEGNVTNVQVVQSTGNQLFDQAAIETLRQWRSAPSQGGTATVPITFQAR